MAQGALGPEGRTGTVPGAALRIWGQILAAELSGNTVPTLLL